MTLLIFVWTSSSSAGLWFALHSTTHTHPHNIHNNIVYCIITANTTHRLHATAWSDISAFSSHQAVNHSAPIFNFHCPIYKKNISGKWRKTGHICHWGFVHLAAAADQSSGLKHWVWSRKVSAVTRPVAPTHYPSTLAASRSSPRGFSPGTFSPAATSATRWLRRSWSWGTAPWLSDPWQHLRLGGQGRICVPLQEAAEGFSVGCIWIKEVSAMNETIRGEQRGKQEH